MVWGAYTLRWRWANPSDESRRALYVEWNRLVNMSAAEIRRFLDSYGSEAGLSRGAARREGVRSGRDSARALLRMIPAGSSYAEAQREWSGADWAWAKRQVAFIKRMRGVSGPLREGGEPTRKLLALKLWGHDPGKA